jgi:hypothetical protein
MWPSESWNLMNMHVQINTKKNLQEFTFEVFFRYLRTGNAKFINNFGVHTI